MPSASRTSVDSAGDTCSSFSQETWEAQNDNYMNV